MKLRAKELLIATTMLREVAMGMEKRMVKTTAKTLTKMAAKDSNGDMKDDNEKRMEMMMRAKRVA